MSDYPDRWFEKLGMVQSRPDLLNGVEMATVTSLQHTRGPPNALDAAMVLNAFDRMMERAADDPEELGHRP